MPLGGQLPMQLGSLCAISDLCKQHSSTQVHQHHAFYSCTHKIPTWTKNIWQSISSSALCVPRKKNPQALNAQLLARIHALQSLVNNRLSSAQAQNKRDYDWKVRSTPTSKPEQIFYLENPPLAASSGGSAWKLATARYNKLVSWQWNHSTMLAYNPIHWPLTSTVFIKSADWLRDASARSLLTG